MKKHKFQYLDRLSFLFSEMKDRMNPASHGMNSRNPHMKQIQPMESSNSSLPLGGRASAWAAGRGRGRTK